MRRRQPSPKRFFPKAIQREFNILQLIHSNGQISRIDLARNTGSSLASLTTIAHRLMQKGFVTEAGRGSTSVGRKPVLLRIRDDLAYFVGVDLGTYFLRVVITDMNGDVVYKMQTETGLAHGRERVLKKTFRAKFPSKAKLTLKMDPMYDYNRFAPDPDEVFQESIGYLEEIQAVVSSLQEKDLPNEDHLVESMSGLQPHGPASRAHF